MFSFDGDLIKKYAKLNNPELEIIHPIWKGLPEPFGMRAEQTEDAENEKSAAPIHSFLEQPHKNGNEENQAIEQSEILLSEQINKKENIEIE